MRRLKCAIVVALLIFSFLSFMTISPVFAVPYYVVRDRCETYPGNWSGPHTSYWRLNTTQEIEGSGCLEFMSTVSGGLYLDQSVSVDSTLDSYNFTIYVKWLSGAGTLWNYMWMINTTADDWVGFGLRQDTSGTPPWEFEVDMSVIDGGGGVHHVSDSSYYCDYAEWHEFKLWVQHDVGGYDTKLSLFINETFKDDWNSNYDFKEPTKLRWSMGDDYDVVLMDDIRISADSPIMISAFSITNPSADDNNMRWLIAEYRWYNFQTDIDFDNTTYFDTLVIRFADEYSQYAIFYYKGLNSSLNPGEAFAWDGAWGTDMIEVHDNATETWTDHANGTITARVTVSVWIRLNLYDTWDVDVEGWANTTAADETGWITLVADYFNIYSEGGLNRLTTSGNAGIITGGDYFNLYAYNDSYAESEIFWRHLVHVKLLLSFKFDHGTYAGLPWQPPSDDYPVPECEIGFKYFNRDNGTWSDYGFALNLRLSSFGWGADWQFTKWYIAIVREVPAGSAVLVSDFLYTWFDDDDDTSSVWIDLWFNKANSSSIAGVRATAFWYAVKNNADWLQRVFTGNNWGVYYANRSSFVWFTELPDAYGNKMYSKQIDMVNVWCKFWQGAVGTGNYSAEISKIQQFDYQFHSDMEGIPTPSFEGPRTPAMPIGGFLGVIASWLSALFDAVSPAFSYIFSGLIWVIDMAIELITGQSGVFSGFVSWISSAVSSVVDFMITLVTRFVTFASMLGNAVSWFFTSFFDSIWGIVEFVLLTPAFNIFTAVATIIGVSVAWLTGSTYVNGWGQTFDFTYLSNMSFGGFSGGIVIFFIIFIVGFFIQILSCFATMSLGPILEPIQLFWGLLQFVFKIIGLMYDLVVKVIQLLVQIAHALRDIAPRPAGV